MRKPDSSTTIILTLITTLHEVGFVAGKAEEVVSRDSEYAGAVAPHSLAVVQQLAEQALKRVSEIMNDDIQSSEGANHE